MDKIIAEARRALRCLYLDAPKDVVDDIRMRCDKVFDEVEKRKVNLTSNPHEVIKRMEKKYDSLTDCHDWQQLKLCFEYGVEDDM